MDTSALVDDSTPIQQRSQVPALQVIGVTKSFPGVRALSSVDFDCLEGEVHALVGENGSGKSTMIKAASGVYEIDEGQIFIGGQELGHGGVQRSRRLGLITAYQDTSLVNELTVADNIALSFNAIGESKPADVLQYLGRFNLPFRQTDLVASLGPGARQLLEVARAMAHKVSEAHGLLERAPQLAAGGDPELREDLAHVPFHGSATEVSLGGDLGIGVAFRGQPGDVGLLGRQVRARLEGTSPNGFAGGEELAASTFGERLDAHRGQCFVRGAQLASRIHTTALSAQPFAVAELSPS
jgi:ABC-type lipopolysaccharide export system ATPase subunit